jgi:hypothetical protein
LSVAEPVALTLELRFGPLARLELAWQLAAGAGAAVASVVAASMAAPSSRRARMRDANATMGFWTGSTSSVMGLGRSSTSVPGAAFGARADRRRR